MAKTMNLNFRGVEIAGAYWMVARVLIDGFNEKAIIYLRCYASEEARRTLAKPIVEDVIEADSNAYYQFFAPEILDAEGMNPQKAAYLFLNQFREPRAEATFFASAEDSLINKSGGGEPPPEV